MKRLITLTAAAGLSLLALLPGVASAAPQSPAPSPTIAPAPGPIIVFNQRPVFNDYLACVGGYVYTDFRDPDGNDALMAVQMAVHRAGTGWTYHSMTNTGPSVHGVFWWSELADHGINPATVTRYAFRATDQAGMRSTWTYADEDCVLD